MSPAASGQLERHPSTEAGAGAPAPRPLAEPMRRISRYSALLVGSTGALVLVGWAADIGVLKSLSPAWVSMKANTALCFLLCGVALAASQEALVGRPRARLVAVVAAAVVASIAVVTIAEYAIGVDMGIDQMLFREPAGTLGTFSPGRMALSTAICFAVVAASVLLLAREGSERIQLYEIGGAGVAALAVQTMLAYVGGSDFSVGAGNYTRMAVHTTVGFLAAASALLCARPGRGWASVLTDTGAGGRLARRLTPVVALVPLCAGLADITGERAGWYHPAFGDALVIVLVTVVLVAVVTALSRSLATEARQAREALDYRAGLLQSIDDAVVATDAQARICMWSRGAERLYGWPESEAVGRSAPDLLAMQFTTTSRGDMGASLRSTGQARAEMRCRNRAGRDIDVETSTATLTGAGGEVTGFVSVHRDVTERKELQARLMVAERMASVGTMAAGVAHEINNPLSYVTANIAFAADALREALSKPGGPPDAAPLDEALTALDEAREGSRRVGDIVRDLKTFSRGNDDAVSPCDVQRALEVSINLAGNEIRHRARLVRDFAPVPPVEAVESRLGQLFLNVLINAAHAIQPGDVDSNEIRVTTRLTAAGQVMVQVRDSGEGMAPDVLERVFDPFFTTKPVGVGMGLGLSICHGIVTSLGGEIQIESAPGAGTTLSVLLPAAAQEQAQLGSAS